jgi:hypothetical protein
VLALTGAGSTFQTLLSREDVWQVVSCVLHLADYYMILMIRQSCCGERAGSHINMTKTQKRTGLGDDTFDDLILNILKMQHLHEMELKTALRKWQKKGHMMGATKAGMVGESSEASSKIVRRHLAEKPLTFLFK